MEFLDSLSSLWRKGGTKIINPEDYGVSLGEFPMAVSGSKVYRGRREGESGSVVFKVYGQEVKGQVGPEEVQRYQSITDKAKALLDGQEVTLLRNDGGRDKFSLVVNPIDRVGKLSGTEEACSVSQFIEGPRLDEQIDQGRYDSSTANKILARISRGLNKKVGTSHISIVPPNVKVDSAGSRLIVTDLYTQVQRLKAENVG